MDKMPVLFVGHGSPMNAIEHNAFTEALTGLSARLPKPKAVCVISAHWVTEGSQVMASPNPRTVHDFYGFPAPLYEVQYPAGAPDEAAKLAVDPEIVPDDKWGLDHGSWSVLRHMYPKADVPAFQLSLDEQRDFKGHLELGREIQSLRERGVLILGSGNIVHNLRRIDWSNLHGRLRKHVVAVEGRDETLLAFPSILDQPLIRDALDLVYDRGDAFARDHLELSAVTLATLEGIAEIGSSGAFEAEGG